MKWDGEGTPVAGREVEALADGKWSRAEWLKEHNGEHAVFFVRSRALGWAKDIRPIRSEEDKAVDEMLKFQPTHATIMELPSLYEFARNLHNAGYRKQKPTRAEEDIEKMASALAAASKEQLIPLARAMYKAGYQI